MKKTLLIMMIVPILAGCTAAKEGGQTTASAGHSPVLQMQNGLHFYTSNTRPIQGLPEQQNESSGLEKISDKLQFGDVEITTTTTISSGDGGVAQDANKDTAQTPTTQVSPETDLTVPAP